MKQQKGNVIKITNGTSYTDVTTNLINNIPEVSAEALRVHMHIKSTPDDWYTNIDNIASHTKLSRAKVTKAIKELESLHLLKREKGRDKGIFEYTYIIYDTPYPNSSSNEGCINE